MDKQLRSAYLILRMLLVLGGAQHPTTVESFLHCRLSELSNEGLFKGYCGTKSILRQRNHAYRAVYLEPMLLSIWQSHESPIVVE
jgi:hypothetical protein